MILLNLLPEEQKKAHVKQHVQHVIRNNLFLVFIVVSLISSLILLGRIYLENKFIAAVEDTTQTAGRLQSPLSQDVQLSNNVLKVAKEIQEEFIPWQNLLITLSNITPPNVVINQMSVTKERGELSLRGEAVDRDSFLTFKNNLETDPLFIEVESPISNILSKTDIVFSLNITLSTDLIE